MATPEGKDGGDKGGRGDTPDAYEVDRNPTVTGEHGFEASVEAARLANEEEHQTSVKDALRIHWKAVMWSLIISMSIIMEGYDMALITNFFAFPGFRRQFGTEFEDGRVEVEGQWQSALGSIGTAG